MRSRRSRRRALALPALAHGPQRRHRRRQRPALGSRPTPACWSPSASRSTTTGPSRAPTATSRCSDGERITDVSVSENGQPLRARRQHGARQPRPARASSAPSPMPRRRAGSSGTTALRRAAHLRRSRYRVIGGAVAYDDVIDVGWKVWGDQWNFDLDHLIASLQQPRRSTRPTRLPGLGRTRATSRARPSAARASRRSRRRTSTTTRGRRDAGHGPARRRARTSAAPGVMNGRRSAEDPRRGAGRRRRLQHALEQVKRWIAHNAAVALALPRSGAGDPRACSLLRLAREHDVSTPEVPAGAARRRPPGARLRARPRGRRQHQHGAGDAARPDRARLLRHQDSATTEEEKLDLVAVEVLEAPERREARPTTSRRCSASSTS